MQLKGISPSVNQPHCGEERERVPSERPFQSSSANGRSGQVFLGVFLESKQHVDDSGKTETSPPTKEPERCDSLTARLAQSEMVSFDTDVLTAAHL